MSKLCSILCRTKPKDLFDLDHVGKLVGARLPHIIGRDHWPRQHCLIKLHVFFQLIRIWIRTSTKSQDRVVYSKRTTTRSRLIESAGFNPSFPSIGIAIPDSCHRSNDKDFDYFRPIKLSVCLKLSDRKRIEPILSLPPRAQNKNT